MKTLVSLVIFCAFILQAKAQQSVLTLSEEFKMKDKGWKDQYISHAVHVDDNFYTVTNSTVSGSAKMKYVFVKLYDINYTVTVTKFDKHMNPIKELELENGAREYGPVAPEVFLFQNNPYIAYFKSSDKASYTLYIAPIDKNTLELGKPIKLSTFDQENVGIFKMQKVLDAAHIFITTSPDQSKLMVLAKNNPASLESFVFDKDFTLLKKSKIKISEAEYSISNPLITNEMVQCILIYGGGVDKVVCQTTEGKRVEAKLVGNAEMKPNLLDTKISNDGKKIYIVAGATVAQEGNTLGCNGFLTYEVDCSSLKVTKPQTYLFTEQYISFMKEIGAAAKEKKKTFVFNFAPKIVELENGKIAIVASPERTIIRESSYMGNNNQWRNSTSVNTFIGPLITFFPNENGKTFTHSIVPRRFHFSYGTSQPQRFITFVSVLGAISKSTAKFIAFNQGNEVLIIYNTLPQSLNLQDLTNVPVATGDKNLVIAETRIGADTKVPVSKQIGDDPEGKYSYFIGSGVPSNSPAFIFPIGKERLKGPGGTNRDIFSYWCFINTKNP